MTYRLGKTLWNWDKDSVSEGQDEGFYFCKEAGSEKEFNLGHTREELLLMGAVADTPPQIEEVKGLNFYGDAQGSTKKLTKKLNQMITVLNTLTQKESI